MTHLFQVTNYRQCPGRSSGDTIIRTKGTGIVLGTLPGDKSCPTTKENSGSNANCPVMGVIHQWRELSRRRVVGITHIWLQHAHIGVDCFFREVYRYIIVLVGIPHVEKYRLVDIFDIYPCFQLFPGVAICSVGGSFQPDIITGDKFLDDMPATIIEFPGMYSIAGIIVRDCRSADEQVDRC